MRGPSQLHGQVRQSVHSVMTSAMRADQAAIGAVVDAPGPASLDPHTAAFLREARCLVLACAAALSAVLDAHPPGPDPYGDEICRGCGIERCRTLSRVGDVLADYGVRPAAVDRAEVWRRADRLFNHGEKPRLLVSVEEFEGGFVAHAAPRPSDETGPLLVFDRRTGQVSRWPWLPREVLAEQYARYRQGTL